jgi:choline dehydrogenase-like flavoprotein
MAPDNSTLQALVNRIIPADDYPSGWQAGVGDFIHDILAQDHRERSPLVESGLVLLEEEARARSNGLAYAQLGAAAQDEIISDLHQGRTVVDWGTLAPREFIALMTRLCAEGFYGDPENGGNRDAVSWSMVGYRVLPPGASWPKIDEKPFEATGWENVAERYDAIVVGSGAGGGIAACVLSEAGYRVLLVERGPFLSASDLRPDHLRNQRSVFGYDTPAGPPARGNPRVLVTSAGEVVLLPSDGRWSNNAMTLGGGTRVYGAQAWRFCPEDFRMASVYGVPPGSSLADWPISYEDLEPDYDRAEWEIGVAGDPSGNVYAGPRQRGYPMPPLPPNAGRDALSRGAKTLGLNTSPVPLLINSVPYNGRGACINCGACVGFGCPGEFKNGTHNTSIPRALATGRCDLLTNARAERILADASAKVMGLAIVTERGDGIERREVMADQVVLGAGAIETARLLLNSPTEKEPRGIGNNMDQVGRNLQGHTYVGAIALFDEIVQDCIGPGPSIATNDYRHNNPGIIGGAMIANDFVPTPLQARQIFASLGAIPAWGLENKRGMRELYSRMAMIWGPVQEIPTPESRVTLDPRVRDSLGIPVARLSGSLHWEDTRTGAFISEKAAEWAMSSGAKKVITMSAGAREGPSGGQHQAGTCRMGSDPASSVTDRWGAVWGHDNLHIVDGSLHVTNGGVNPVLTIMALAYRVSRHVVEATSQ